MKNRFNQHWKRVLASGLFACLLCAPAFVGAVTEVEPNDTKADAQVLVISDTGEASVTEARLGLSTETTTTDIDIYSFEYVAASATADAPVISLTTAGDWDAILYLYDSLGNLINSNDDAYPPTEGSACLTMLVACDPRIDSGALADGTYYVAVGPAMRFMWTNFEVHPSFLDPQKGGAYELLIQGLQPVVTGGSDGGDVVVAGGGDETGGDDGGDVVADDTDTDGDGMMKVMITTLHEHKDDPALGTYKGKKTIPVAIHSMAGFNAMKDVDQRSLTFGATGDEESLLKCKKKGKKVKVEGVKDHDKDLVCYFRPDRAKIVEGDMSATLKGKTKDGKEFEGSGILRVFRLPTQKTMNWYQRHDLDPRAVKPKKVKKHGKKSKKDKSAKKDG